MSKSKDVQVANRYIRPLVQSRLGQPNAPLISYVLVSHLEVDRLVGRIMQVCDLTGDQEQRKALKDELKQRTRNWLDDLYDESGYDIFTGAREAARIIVDEQ